jgi:hypothetical protein
MTTDTLISWTGWIRRGRGPWRLFCRAATEQAALDVLLRDAPAGVDKLVRAGDGDPNIEAQSAMPRRRRF